jgi:hypothetical protein
MVLFLVGPDGKRRVSRTATANSPTKNNGVRVLLSKMWALQSFPRLTRVHTALCCGMFVVLNCTAYFEQSHDVETSL